MVAPADDRRILVVSEVGCGPPHRGNRARMAALLAAIKEMGYVIHFAGVGMHGDEKRALLPAVDRWVADFDVPSTSGLSLAGLRQRVRGAIARFRRSGRRQTPGAMADTQSLDRLMAPHWVDQMRAIQAHDRYRRVLVAYVFHSAFFDAFSPDCLKVLDTHDVFGDRNERLERAGLKSDWFSTTCADERRGLLRADRIIAIQDEERHVFQRLLEGKREVFTVGHLQPARFVDFQPGSSTRIGYFASDNPLNVQSLEWFLEKCWSRVLGECPDARLVVGGRICRVLGSPGNGVELAGEMADPMAFHAKSLFSINPMPLGTGLKIKTVEALSAGRPVVTFEAGAAGLVGMVGRGLIVVTTAEQFAEACAQLLRDPSAASVLGRAVPTTMETLNAAWRDQLRSALDLQRPGPV